MLKFLAPYKLYLQIGILTALIAGGAFLYSQAKHRYDSAIEAAVEQGRQEVMLRQERAINEAVREERQENELEKERLRRELRSRNQEVNDLRRKLQVEHELDALLQAKPGLVLKAVQNGTNKVLTEFEEITQWEE